MKAEKNRSALKIIWNENIIQECLEELEQLEADAALGKYYKTLLEECAEEIENCYGKETDLTIKIRRLLEGKVE